MTADGTEDGRELGLTVRTWLKMGVRRMEPIPAEPLAVPLTEARLAVVSTGGATAPGQEPFETGKTGDASFRTFPSALDPSELRFDHPHYDTDGARRDPDTILPLSLLRTMVEAGEVGELAPTAVSMMGYVPLTRQLTGGTAPEIGELMQGEEVDAALLCPA